MPKKKRPTKSVAFSDKQEEDILSILNESIASSNPLEHGKTISVIDLPECHHKDILVPLVFDPKSAKICVIAVKQNDGKWQAYAGYPDVLEIKTNAQSFGDAVLYDWKWLCENIHDAEQTKMMGEKLPKEAAVILFPDWDKDQYLVEHET